MYDNFSGEENHHTDSENNGSVDEIILHVQELLDDGFYDDTVRDEAISMLNTARLSTDDHQSIEQIDTLLDDIESRYGDGK